MNVIPEKITNFNVYSDGEKLVGVTGEVTLPKLESMTETLTGAGIAGEFESSTPGHYKAISIDIPFRVLYDHSFEMMLPKGQTITLRGSQQFYDASSGQMINRQLKITLKVMPKGIELGKFSIGKPTETKNTLEVSYIKIEEDGKTLLELDKINFICNINGTDVLAEIRKQI